MFMPLEIRTVPRNWIRLFQCNKRDSLAKMKLQPTFWWTRESRINQSVKNSTAYSSDDKIGDILGIHIFTDQFQYCLTQMKARVK